MEVKCLLTLQDRCIDTVLWSDLLEGNSQPGLLALPLPKSYVSKMRKGREKGQI